MLAGAHKKFYRIQHPEIYLLDLKVQYKHKIKLPRDMVSKHVLLYLCLPDYFRSGILCQSNGNILETQILIQRSCDNDGWISSPHDVVGRHWNQVW